MVIDLSSAAFVGVRGFAAALLAAATNAHRRNVAFWLIGCSPQVLRLLAVLGPDRTLVARADSGHARHRSRPRSSGRHPREHCREPAFAMLDDAGPAKPTTTTAW